MCSAGTVAKPGDIDAKTGPGCATAPSPAQTSQNMVQAPTGWFWAEMFQQLPVNLIQSFH